jgi:predicted DNA-binding transcriptional regulator YafY
MLLKLKCHKSLAGVFIDRFGVNAIITPCDEYFEIIIEAAISPVFFSWLMQFGDKVTVLSPESVKEELVVLAGKVISANS